MAPILTPTFSATDDAAENIEVAVFASPTRIQEGDNVTITIEIRQAEAEKNYTFRIDVTNPAETSSALNISVVADATGFGNVSAKYWEAFPDANTSYVGAYNIEVRNVTTNEIFVNASFEVGLTDKLRYARNENVTVQASGYKPNENVTINVKLAEESVDEQNATASVKGIVNFNWAIPENATPGVYTISIVNATTPGTVKSPPDAQDFYVEVWQVQVWVRNFANESVANLTIKVENHTWVPTQFFNSSVVTNETGWSSFLLATGNYTLRAFWKQLPAGNLTITITEDTVSEEEGWVQLTNLEITVIDGATNEALPFIQLRLEYNNITETVETDFNGRAFVHNLFTNVNYTAYAKRYGLSLPSSFQLKILPLNGTWNKATLEFPAYTVFVHVEDSKNNPAEGVEVKAYEWSSGLTGQARSVTTGSDGNVTLFLTFGRYRLRVYSGTTFLDETRVDVTRNQSSFLISLSVYNIDFSVVVTDYFGQPVPNALVKVEREATPEPLESTTSLDGRVTFSGVLGGTSRISVYIGGELSGTREVFLTDSKQVSFSVGRYVVVVGNPVETSQFVTAIGSAVLIAAFAVGSNYKRLLKLFMKGK